MGEKEKPKEMISETNEGPIDPTQLLSAISSLLGTTGEVKGTSEVARIVSLMKESKKMVSKCIYMNILQSTKETDVLNTFIEKGGWEVLNTWLQSAKEEDDQPFLIELLRVYQAMPVTIDLLKKNNSAKTIKKLAAVDNSDLKELAGSIVETWTKKIKEKSAEGDSSDKHKKHHKKHHHKSHHHHKSKDRSSSDKEHHKRSEGSRKGSLDSRADSPSQSNNNKEEEKPSKSRTPSAKTAPTRFRSTGLEEENVLPQIKKKSSLEKPLIKRPIPSSNASKVGTPPEKKKRPMPLNQPLNGPHSSQTSPSEPKGIKIIPAKPRPPVSEVYESSGFMDAITTTQSVRRKRKISTDQTKSQTSPPPHQKQVVPSFYTDTMEASPEKENVKEEEGQMSPVDKQSDTSEQPSKDDVSETASTVSENTQDGEPVKKRKKNTRVSWAEDNALVSIRYFEMDDTERVNVNRLKNFAEIMKEERLLEKQNLESNKRLHMHTLNTQEVSEWRKPPVLSGLTSVIVKGSSSKEKEVQKKREESVLQALYFDKKMIPDTAAEPDLEEVEYEEPRIIPLSDGSGEVETVVDYSAETAPPKPDAILTNAQSKSAISLPPDIASLLSSLAKDTKLQNPVGKMSPQSMTNVPPGAPDVQAVIQSIMTNTPNLHEDEASRNLRLALEPFREQIKGLMNTNPSSVLPMLMALQQPVPPNHGMPPQEGFPPAGMMGMGPPPHNYMGPGPRGPPPRGYPRPPFDDMHGGPPMMRGRMRGPMMPNRGGPPRGHSSWNRGRGGPPPGRGGSLCKFYTQNGRCKWGDNCGFSHVHPSAL